MTYLSGAGRHCPPPPSRVPSSFPGVNGRLSLLWNQPRSTTPPRLFGAKLGSAETNGRAGFNRAWPTCSTADSVNPF